MIEVFFDADHFLSVAKPAELTHEPASHNFVPGLNVPLPASRRCSTSSSISCASPIQLFPTLPPAPSTCASDAAWKTSPRPTSNFRPSTRGFDVVAIFLVGGSNAEDAVLQARDLAIMQSARELELVRRLAPRTNVPGLVARAEWAAKVAEVADTVQIQGLRDAIEEVEKRVRTGRGLFRGVRRRFA